MRQIELCFTFVTAIWKPSSLKSKLVFEFVNSNFSRIPSLSSALVALNSIHRSFWPFWTSALWTAGGAFDDAEKNCHSSSSLDVAAGCFPWDGGGDTAAGGLGVLCVLRVSDANGSTTADCGGGLDGGANMEADAESGGCGVPGWEPDVKDAKGE